MVTRPESQQGQCRPLRGRRSRRGRDLLRGFPPCLGAGERRPPIAGRKNVFRWSTSTTWECQPRVGDRPRCCIQPATVEDLPHLGAFGPRLERPTLQPGVERARQHPVDSGDEPRTHASGNVVNARQDEQGPGIGGVELIAVERVCDHNPMLLERFRFHPSFAGIPEPVLLDALAPGASEIGQSRRCVYTDEIPQRTLAESLHVRGVPGRHADAELSLSQGDSAGRRWADLRWVDEQHVVETGAGHGRTVSG